MLKQILTRKKYFSNIYKEQKGITGLETAIILIAFVVVAAVFAYTVLSAGLFSTQKSQQAVYSGLQEAQSTVEVKGGVTSNGVAQLDSMDAKASGTGWQDDNGASSDSGTKVEGVGSMVINAAAAADGDTLAHHAMIGKTWNTGDTVTFWAQLGDTAMNGQISLAFNTAGNASDLGNSAPDEVIIDTTTALNPHVADLLWHKYSMAVTASGTTTVDYGFYVSGSVAGASQTIYIDDIEITDANLYTITDPMATFANSVTFTLGLAASGNPIDFTADTDTNKNGIFDELNPIHKVIVNYNDSTQTVSDLAWTLTKLGSDDGDAMLSGNEKYQLTVDLTYINQHASAGNKIGANHAFTLEVKPPTGAVLTLSRTMPGKIQTVNNLN